MTDTVSAHDFEELRLFHQYLELLKQRSVETGLRTNDIRLAQSCYKEIYGTDD